MHKIVKMVKTFLTEVETNEFLSLFAPDDIYDVKTTSNGEHIYYTVIYNFLRDVPESDCGTNI